MKTREQKLRRALLTEELFELTGDSLAAVVLHQFIYWCSRTRTTDRYFKEERARAEHNDIEIDKEAIKPPNGWIYKTSEELRDEIMESRSAATVRRRIQDLVDQGWLQERNNPNHKWDRTLQYRVNLVKIERDLLQLGYTLATLMGDEYPFILTPDENGPPILHGADSISNDAESNLTCADALSETTAETCAETVPPKGGPEAPPPDPTAGSKNPVSEEPATKELDLVPEEPAPEDPMPEEPSSPVTESDQNDKGARKRPVAVDVFRSAAHRFPAKSWWPRIEAIVGDAEDSLALWRETVFEWVGHGWNPTNVSGMLNCYQTGGVKKGGNGRSSGGNMQQEIPEIADPLYFVREYHPEWLEPAGET